MSNSDFLFCRAHTVDALYRSRPIKAHTIEILCLQFCNYRNGMTLVVVIFVSFPEQLIYPIYY